MRSFLGFMLILAGALILAPVAAQNNTITELCDGSVQARPADFEPGGIILTAFDGAALWVYDIERATRYPLPDTRPCLTNCRLGPDADWLIFPNPSNMVFTRMRLDGTQREALYDNVTDMTWWTRDIYLIWTADHRAYLQPADNARPREEVPTRGVLNIQPAGQWGILVEQYEGEFWRTLVDLATRNLSGMLSGNEARIYLAPDTPYFNAGVWSPDGENFAFVGLAATPDAKGVIGGELSFVQAGSLPEIVTDFTTATGALRIGGYNPASLHWSPDSSKLAFWGTPLTGADPEKDTGDASIYILDAATRQLTHYCGFKTSEHSPSPSRLIWSPDGTTLAFAGNVTGDDKASLLLALDVATGKLTELSDGIFPALGLPDVVAWGHKP